MKSMEQTPKQEAAYKFGHANTEKERQDALDAHEQISYDQVINASSPEELQTLYHEAMVHSPSRALALEKLAKAKGWDLEK